MSKAAEIFDTSHPLINFMGITEWTIYDYGVGFASGFFKKDMQSEWSECVKGAPEVVNQFQGITAKLADVNWLDIGSIFANFSLWQDLFNIGMDLFRNGPSEFKACSAIVTEFNDFGAFIIKHLDLAQTGINIVTNLGSHFMEIAGSVMSMVSDAAPGHSYELGKDSGSLFISLME